MKELPEEKTALTQELDRIVKSEAFRSSESLRRLLLYLGNKSLAGEAGDLKEYVVGVEAFGKSSAYDPQLDASVRIQAGKLRQKLQEFYRTEGMEDTVVVSLPKGHFQLDFELRSKPQERQQLQSVPRKWKIAVWSLAAATLLCCSCIAYLLLSVPSGNQPDGNGRLTADLRAIWDPVLKDDRPLVVAVGTPLFTKIGQGFYRDPAINEWNHSAVPSHLERLRDTLGATTLIPAPIYTGIGEATAAFLLCRLLSSEKDLEVRRSSALSWDDVKENNMIFVGCQKYNLQLRDLLSQQDFFMDGNHITNRRPRKGEPHSFTGTCPPDSAYVTQDFAVVTKLPNVQGRELFALAASSTEGTWAASEFLTNEIHARELVSLLRTPSGEMPDSYQVVIRARFRGQVPFEMAIVAERGASPAKSEATDTQTRR
ncbi:MAG: hypothetical protein EHM61_27100 [Acidobacteria bacterium]|nr:MAG: hypothetical protein EHM61_27100 [Acidobacteriota bacterium]